MTQPVPLTSKRAALPNPAERPAATEVIRKLEMQVVGTESTLCLPCKSCIATLWCQEPIGN